jgi:uncharacterized protein YcbX
MQVSMLSMTPIKGLALHHPESVEVTSGGVVGDRAFFLVDASDELISCTELGGLMRHRAEYDAGSGVLQVYGADGLLRSEVVEPGEPLRTDFYGLRSVPGHVVGGWEELFSDIAGQPVRLVLGQSGAFDVKALTLLGTASTDQLAERSDADPVDSRRFRMNVEFAGAAPHDEDSWDGRELAVGSAVLRVGGPVRRCAATTRNPDSGIVDLQTLRLIRLSRGRQQTAEFGHGFYFGVYADVLVPGRITLGDEVTVGS